MIFNRVSLFKSIDSSLGALLCRTLGAVNYLSDGRNEVKRVNPERISNILLIRPGGMGDMIVLLPVIKTLQKDFPDASIKVVCEKRNMEVLKLAGMEDYAFVYDTNPFAFLWKIFKGDFDIAIDTEQFHHFSAIFALLSGAAVRIGFKINPRRNPLYTHLINYAPDGPEGEQFMKLLAPLPFDAPEYNLESVLQNAHAGNEPPPGTPRRETYAAVHMGTSNSYKLWEENKYIELIKHLHKNHKLGTVLIGNKKDARSAEVVVKEAGNAGAKTISFTGKLNLLETCEIIRNSRIFIGTDSGLAHLAIALGVSTIVLFGPSDHIKWGLNDEKHAVVKQDLPCSPCFIFGYHKPCKTIACMKNISVGDVVSACDKTLSS